MAGQSPAMQVTKSTLNCPCFPLISSPSMMTGYSFFKGLANCEILTSNQKYKKNPHPLIAPTCQPWLTLPSQRSILYCRNKASLCPRQSFWGGQVQNNSHRNQLLSFLSSRHLYTENHHLCLQNKPLALQLYGLSQGDSKCKGFVMACRT